MAMPDENPYAEPPENLPNDPLPEMAGAGSSAADPSTQTSAKVSGPRAAQSSLWMLLTRLGTLPLAIVTSALVTRYLGKSDRGSYAFLVLFGNLVLPCLTLGFGGAIIYFISSGRYRMREVLATCLLVGVAQGLLDALLLGLLWYCGWLGTIALTMPTLSMILALASLPVQGANLMLQRAMLGNSWYGVSNLITLAASLINSLSLLTLVVVGNAGLQGAAIAMLITHSVLLAFSLAVLSRHEVPALAIQPKFAVDGFQYGIRIWLGDLASRANLRLDQWVLSLLKSSEAMGVYSTAVNVSELLWLVPDSLNYVLYNKIAGSKSARSRIALTERVHRALLLLMVVAGLALALSGRWVVRLMFGREFDDVTAPLLLLIPGTVAMTSTKVITKYVAGSGRPGASSKITAIGTALSAALYFTLIPLFDVWGAALASTLGYIFMALVAVVMYRRLIVPRTSGLFQFSGQDLRFLADQIRVMLGRPKPPQPVANDAPGSD